jgi:hypothetical protein
MRVRPVFLISLLVVAAWGGRVWWLRAHRAARTVAYTTCPFRGPARVVIRTDIQPWDTLAVRVHEEVHAAQCRDLGPVRYRLRSLTANGKLSLEAPAYCAAARARLAVEHDREYASDRLHTDMIEGLSDVADSGAVKEALARECPEIALQPRRTGRVRTGRTSSRSKQ